MVKRRTFIFIQLGLLAWAALSLSAAEFEVTNNLRVDNYAVVQGSADVLGSSFSVGGSSFSVKYGMVGVGTSAPSALLHVSSAPGVSGNLLVISTGASNVIRMTGSGEIYANKLYGDGSGLSGVTGSGDNLGSHTATQNLNLNGFNIVNVSTMGAYTSGVYFSTHAFVMGNFGVGTSTPAYKMHLSAGDFRNENGMRTGNIADPGRWRFYDISGYLMSRWVPGTDYDTWGLYWDQPNHKVIWRGNGVDAASVDLDDGSGTYAGLLTIQGVSTQVNVLQAGTNGVVISTGGAITTTGAGHGTVAGNARGNGAVDLQTWRSAPAQAATGGYSVISGGNSNTAAGLYDTVAGGYNNSASNQSATISGGENNTVNNTYATVAGGIGNTGSGYSSVVSGGYGNTATNLYSAVLGGQRNTAGGFYSSVPGGYGNLAQGNYSFAAGFASTATANGTFVWADSQGLGTNNQAADSVLFKTRGGFLVTGSTNTNMTGLLDRGVVITGNGLVGISTGTPGAALDVVSAGSTINDYAQIWRNKNGVVIASMTSTGYMALSGVPGDSLGSHIAVQNLNMAGYGIVNVSSVAFAVSNASNVYVGANAGYVNVAGVKNTFVGYAAGASDTGSWNTFIGERAGTANTSGTYNTFVGQIAGKTNVTGSNNTFLGANAGYWNASGAENTGLGYDALFNLSAGSANTVVGNYAGNGGDISSNTIVGYSAGTSMAGGKKNILLGYKTGSALVSGSDNLVIGNDQEASSPSAANEMNIGGVLFGDMAARTIGISTRTPQAALDIVSTGTVDTVYANIWRNSNGVIVASMTSTGKLYANVTGITAGGDNLGSHTATQDLQMQGYNILNAGGITANGQATVYSSFTVAGSSFTVGGSTLVVQGGKVGIGNSGPLNLLEVGDAALGVHTGKGIFVSNTSMNSHFDLGQGAANRGRLLWVYNATPANAYLSLGTAGGANNLVLQDAGGYVGISTGTPQGRLDILSAGSTQGDMATIWRRGDGVIVGSMSATGVMAAVRFVGDGSGITNIGGSDNLGNHTATQDLKMQGFSLVNAASGTFNQALTVYSSATVAGAAGVGTPKIYFTPNVEISSYSAVYGAGISVSTLVYTPGIVLTGYGELQTQGIGRGTVAGNARGAGAVDLQVNRGAVTRVASGGYSVIAGGQDNTAGGLYSSVGGGSSNIASSQYGTVSGGINNNAAGDRAMIPGGDSNFATGSYSLAAGYRASSNANGDFTWADSGGQPVNNSVADRTLFKNAGGFMITGSTNTVMTGTLDRGLYISGNGLVGISTGSPAAALDVVSTGTTSAYYAQIWRNSSGVVVASMTADGRFYANVAGATGGSDNLGNHTATQNLNMANYAIVGVSSATIIAPDTIASSLWVSTASTFPQLYVSTAGLVGLGTASPLGRLHIVDNATNIISSNTTVGVSAGTARVPTLMFTSNASGPAAWDGYTNFTYNSEGFLLRHNGGSLAGPSNGPRGLGLATGGRDVADLFIETNGNVGVSSTTPQYRLVVSSGAGEAGDLVVISTGMSNIIRMTGSGEIYASKFYGDVSGTTGLPTGDNLGTHTATQNLNMNGFGIYNATSVYVTAGVLGGTAGSSQTLANLSFTDVNTDNLMVISTRQADGASWTTAGIMLKRRVDLTDMGYLRFGSQSADPITFGMGQAEYMRIDNAGNLAIGSNSPGARLDVKASGATPDVMAQIWRNSAGTVVSSVSATGLVAAAKMQIVSAGALPNDVIFSVSSGTAVSQRLMTVYGGGLVYARGGVTYAGDLAELYRVEGDGEAGDVMMLGAGDGGTPSVTRATAAGPVLGIVATSPGITIGHGDLGETGRRVPVALSGRVPVKVSLENGPVKAGTMLAPSSVPGKAAAALRSGMVIGMALEDFDPAKGDKVLCFVSHQYWVAPGEFERLRSEIETLRGEIRRGR
jgi:hypothetical protein